MNWIDFGRDQWTLSIFLLCYHDICKNFRVDFIILGTGVHHDIRFWARSAQGQRSMNLVWKCYFYLVTVISGELLGGFLIFYHTCSWHRGTTWWVDELIRFWARWSIQGQRSQVNELGLIMLFLPRYRDIWRTPSGVDFYNVLGTRVLIRCWARSVQGQRSMNLV